MKARLIKKKAIESFLNENARARSYFSMWLILLKKANWEQPGDILKTFGSADLLGKGSNRIVFDISGNHYRLICKYQFDESHIRLYVKWIGTHAEYTALCNKGEQFTINSY
jgi:mRNA interferase HigB